MASQTRFQPWGRGSTALPRPAVLRSQSAAATSASALGIKNNPSEFHPMAAAAASGSCCGLLVAVQHFQGTASFPSSFD